MTHADADSGPTESLPAEQPPCPRCLKPVALCVCDEVAPVDNRIELVILMHPQEQDRTLGTARLAALHFAHATLKIGLSWPSLSKILGRTVDPQRWAVVYLGSVKPADLGVDGELIFVDRKGQAEERQSAIARSIEGVILLDGTWSQAKALWWRNPWLLKCQRVVLAPTKPSGYGRLRREPRREGLSTIEAAGLVMSALERKPEIAERLGQTFGLMLARYRAAAVEGREAAGPRRSRGGKPRTRRSR